jgi:hypothetical protein
MPKLYGVSKKQAFEVLVDEEDYELYKDSKLGLSMGYPTVKGTHLHVLIQKKKVGFVIDHIDQNPLNNMRSNLRHVIRAQNAQNVDRKTETSTSQYIGVCASRNKWSSKCNGVYIKAFTQELHAAYAHDLYAKANNFLKLNNVPEPTDWDPNFVLPVKKTKKSKRHAVPSEVTNRNSDGVAIIKITNSKNVTREVMVDDSDWFELMKYKWSMSGKNYYKSTIDGKIVKLHRFILLGFESKDYIDTDEPSIVDHINRNSHDNRRSNLRVTTHKVNNRNRTKKENATSQFVGVTKAPSGSWVARLSTNDDEPTCIRLGSYKTEEAAVLAYEAEAKAKNLPTVNDVSHISESATQERITKKITDKTTSLYLGVSKNAAGGFYSRIVIDKNKKHLGTYDDEIKAAIIYNREAIEANKSITDHRQHHLLNKNLPDIYVESSIKEPASTYAGVTRTNSSTGSKWTSRFTNKDGNRVVVGNKFTTDLEAAIARNNAIIEEYKEDAHKHRLNVLP